MQETHESPDSKHIINKARVGTFMGRLSIAILVGMGLVLVLHILSGNATDALFVAAGMIPIMVSLWLIKRESIELDGMVIAMSLTTMFTALATTGQGVYDIGTVAFPAILIISSLILKRNMVIYLTGFITLCNAWLTFGAIYGLYQPTYPQEVFAGQFLTTTVILFITMGAVYALANTTRNSLDAVHKELQEREKVEKALREAENKYRTLVEETSVIIYRDAPVDEGSTAYISPQIVNLLGYSIAEWQKPAFWQEITHPDDIPLVLSEIKNYLATGNRSVVEYRMKTKDNRWIWFQDESLVIKGDDGKPLYIHGVLIDITKRKNAELKIRQREAILGAVAETAQLLLKSRNWRDDINAVLKLLGEATGASHVYIFENHTADDGIMLSSQKYEWVPAGMKPELDNPVYQNTKLMPIPGIEDWYTNLSNGKPFYGSGREYPEFWEKTFEERGLKTLLDVPVTVNGQWWGVIGFDDFFNEMPWSKAEADALVAAAGSIGAAIERQQAYEALQIAEEKFELAFHHTYVAMAINNAEDHRLLDVNEAFANVTGYSREDVIGKRAGRDLNIWPHKSDRDFILDSLAQHGFIDEYRAEFRRKDGEIGVGLLSAVNISIAGKACQLYSFFDISRIDQLMNELRSKNEELQNFTYTVSHDLKAPLVTISGFLGYLEQDAKKGDTERVHGDVVRINEAVSKMQRLLNELLELSRIGRLMNPPEEVAFDDIVQDALKMVEGQLEARQARVEVEADLPSVYGDRIRLVQVVQNLVDNAVKFMGEQANPLIRIGVRHYDRNRVFFVQDNGIGVEADQQERIFGLFNKLDANTDGTGIGLALVKRIVEVHGGSIWVESAEAGKGSTFCFTLAIRPEKGKQ